jgi:hypothetical protein
MTTVTTASPDARAARLAALTERFSPEERREPPYERYALVEIYEGDSDHYWLSTHPSPKDAGEYSASTEAESGFVPYVLVDLDTGAEFTAERAVSYTWRPNEGTDR